MVAKKQNLEFFLFQFFYFHINDGQHVKLHESTNIFKLARCKKPEFWAIFSVKSKMAAKKRDLEIFCFSFFYFHINDGLHVKFQESSNSFKLARCKKPEFWATFSVKSKMAAKKRDLEIFCFRFFIFISMMVNMLNFMNLVTFSSSLDAKNLNSGLFLA